MVVVFCYLPIWEYQNNIYYIKALVLKTCDLLCTSLIHASAGSSNAMWKFVPSTRQWIVLDPAATYFRGVMMMHVPDVGGDKIIFFGGANAGM